MKRADTANRNPGRLAAGVLAALCVALAVSPAVQALELQRGSKSDRRLEPPRIVSASPRAGLSKDRLIKQVENQYKARVVRAEEKRTKDGRVYYEMRLLSEDGFVRDIKVDAESGKTL
jgi:uncharacterized membrane protein YkoI